VRHANASANGLADGGTYGFADAGTHGHADAGANGHADACANGLAVPDALSYTLAHTNPNAFTNAEPNSNAARGHGDAHPDAYAAADTHSERRWRDCDSYENPLGLADTDGAGRHADANTDCSAHTSWTDASAGWSGNGTADSHTKTSGAEFGDIAWRLLVTEALI
jgi:hypothetical protein